MTGQFSTRAGFYIGASSQLEGSVQIFSFPTRSASRSRMGLLISIQQSVRCDVQIDLRCRQLTMAEQFLDAPEIGSAVKQVGGEAVSERMRTRPIRQSGSLQVSLEQAAHAA